MNLNLRPFKNEENLEFIIKGLNTDESGNKRFPGIRDVRDTFTKLLNPENKDLLEKFKNTEEYTIAEVNSDLLKKQATSDSQKDLLNLPHRLAELKTALGAISTLPWPVISSSTNEKAEFKTTLEEINKATNFVPICEITS